MCQGQKHCFELGRSNINAMIEHLVTVTGIGCYVRGFCTGVIGDRMPGEEQASDGTDMIYLPRDLVTLTDPSKGAIILHKPMVLTPLLIWETR